MGAEVGSHTRLQDRCVFFGVQTTAVHDAHAPAPAVAVLLDELPYAGARLRRRHTVQVETIPDVVLSALQFPDFAPVNARRGEVVVWSVAVVGRRLRLTRRADLRSRADPPARIRSETGHIHHLARE